MRQSKRYSVPKAKRCKHVRVLPNSRNSSELRIAGRLARVASRGCVRVACRSRVRVASPPSRRTPSRS